MSAARLLERTTGLAEAAAAAVAAAVVVVSRPIDDAIAAGDGAGRSDGANPLH